MCEAPISPFGWDYINDISAIPEDKNDVIDFLLHRIERGQIYTWVGPLLLSTNPGNEILTDLYDKAHQTRYSVNINEILVNAEPHVYAIANRARYRLVHGLGRVSQVIVISGESGTGKTYNALRILDFLAGIDKNLGASDIAQEIATICPLVSAFSTAGTERNPRSSRHGQLVQLQYGEGAIRGAQVNSFLLERTRVTMRTNNFEIFYQLLAGLDDEQLTSLGLAWDDQYAILGATEHRKRYYSNFQDTMRALETLQFAAQSKEEIFQVLALLLHLGNVKFLETKSDGVALNTEDAASRRATESACRLANLPERELVDLLTTTLIAPKSSRRRHTVYRRPLQRAEDCRHRLSSIIRWLYDKLFHWLVDRLNEVIAAKGERFDWLGILDIYGFEFFEENRMEQLCVNYSTERLQLYFMENYLENGRNEAAEEGLSIIPPPPTISVYRDRVNVMEQSLFWTLNDACQAPVMPSLTTIAQQVMSRQSKARDFLTAHADSFVVDHYSRPVEYNVHDVLEKNTDKVPSELSMAFLDAHSSLLKILTHVPQDFTDTGRVSAKKSTTLSKLKSSMDALMEQLNKCDTHYVRCVRPRKVEGEWQREEFRNQLTCSGILDALPLARCKLPVRFTYEEFLQRYSFPADANNLAFFCELALRKIFRNEDTSASVHLGTRRVFLAESLFLRLERQRREYRATCARKIADFWKKYRLRKEEALPVEIADELLLKPQAVVSRPSISTLEDDDEVFVDAQAITPASISRYVDAVEKTPVRSEDYVDMPKIPVDSLTITDLENNNVEKVVVVPKITLNDETVNGETSPVAETIVVHHSGSVGGGEGEASAAEENPNEENHMEKDESEKVSPAEENKNEEIALVEKPAISELIQHQAEPIPEKPEFDEKSRYVAEWLKRMPSPSEAKSEETTSSSKVSSVSPESSQSFKLAKFSTLFRKKSETPFGDLSNVEWSEAGQACMIHLDNGEKLFYKNGILSKRAVSGAPIRFHIKPSCLPGSHCLPRSEVPWGLEDCL